MSHESCDVKRTILRGLLCRSRLLTGLESAAVFISELARRFQRGHRLRERVWVTLPGEVDRRWRARAQMKIMPSGNRWRIEGAEKEQPRPACAVLDQGRLAYKLV